MYLWRAIRPTDTIRDLSTHPTLEVWQLGLGTRLELAQVRVVHLLLMTLDSTKNLRYGVSQG